MALRRHTLTDIKLGIVGPESSGKTCLTSRLFSLPFEKEYIATIGANFLSITKAPREEGNEEVRYQGWDTPGRDRYRSLLPMYLRGAEGIIFCVNLSTEWSLANQEGWLSFIRSMNTDSNIIVVGTKADIDVGNVAALQDFCKKNSLREPIITSAKTNTGIESLWEFIEQEVKKIPSWSDTTIVDSTCNSIFEEAGYAFDKAIYNSKETFQNKRALKQEKQKLLIALAKESDSTAKFTALHAFETGCARILNYSQCQQHLILHAVHRYIATALASILVATPGFALGFLAGLPLGPFAMLTGFAGAIAALGATVAAERTATQCGFRTLGLFGLSAIDSSIAQIHTAVNASEEPMNFR